MRPTASSPPIPPAEPSTAHVRCALIRWKPNGKEPEVRTWRRTSRVWLGSDRLTAGQGRGSAGKERSASGRNVPAPARDRLLTRDPECTSGRVPCNRCRAWRRSHRLPATRGSFACHTACRMREVLGRPASVALPARGDAPRDPPRSDSALTGSINRVHAVPGRYWDQTIAEGSTKSGIPSSRPMPHAH